MKSDNFGGYPVFETTVDTNILLFQKSIPGRDYRATYTNIKSDFKDNNLVDYIGKSQNEILQNQLDDSSWSLADENVLRLKEKVQKVGIPLKDWDIRICFGIKTGFNEAFIIDTETKEKLCAEDPKSAEILKPILRGRDIGRYYYKWAGLYLINAHNGYSNVPRINIPRDYPALWKYLQKINQETDGAVERRWDKGDHWTNLRDCAYLKEFEKEKIVCPDIAEGLSFMGEDGYYYHTNTTYFLYCRHYRKYLIAILNSNLLDWYYHYISSQLGSKGIRHFSIYIEQLPIPKIPEEEQHPFTDLVDNILSITKSDDYLANPSKQAKVKELERQIDPMVYELYGLTPQEIAVVEGSDSEGANKVHLNTKA